MANRQRPAAIVLGLLAGSALLGCTREIPPQPRIPVPEPPVCTNQNLTPEALFSKAKQGVAVISRDNLEGSGFIIRHQDGNTLLITNAHVVEGADSATVKWADGRQDDAAVLTTAGGSSPQTDLAILQVRGIRGTPLDLKTAKPNVGADVVAIGAPKGLEFSLTRGVVSSLRDDGQILQIDAPINPGNSGGPILDRTGCVVGIATFKLRDSEGLNFAVATSVIDEFLRKPFERKKPSDGEGGEGQPEQQNPDNPTPPPPPDPDPEPEPNAATCWFEMESDSSKLEGFRCSVTSRQNANGDKVFDVVQPDGTKRSVVLWDNKTAEVFVNGQRYEGEWFEDDEGDIRVTADGAVFAFRYRE